MKAGKLLCLFFLPFLFGGEKKMVTFQVWPVGYVVKKGGQTKIQILEEYRPALLGLDGFSHIHVLWWFHRNDIPPKRRILQVHPRGNPHNPLTGVFATRSPVRPNLIALTTCKIKRVAEDGVEVEWIDAFDGTPVLDIKPYIPGLDRVVRPKVPDWIKRR